MKTTPKKKAIHKTAEPKATRILRLDEDFTLEGEDDQDLLYNLLGFRQQQYSHHFRGVNFAELDPTMRDYEYVSYAGCSISKFPYFEQAEKSALDGIERVLARRPVNEWKECLQFVFDMVDNDVETYICVHRLRGLLNDAPYDRNFFAELRKPFPKGKKRAELHVTDLTLYLLAYWTQHLLWMATDYAATLYLQRQLGLTNLSETAFSQERRRLGLKQFRRGRKPITGFSTTSGFVFKDDTFISNLSS